MSSVSGLILAAAAVVLAVLAVQAVVWRRALVAALPWLVVLDGLAVPVAGLSLRVEQAAAALLVVPLVAGTLIGRHRFRTDSTVRWLAAILALNVAVTLWHSPAPRYSLMQCANLASVMVIYLLVLNFVETRADADRFLRGVLRAVLAAAALGSVAYGLALAGVKVGGAEVSRAAVENLTNAYGAYGTMIEPNIFGSLCASGLLLAGGLLVIGRQRPELIDDSPLLRWVAGVCGVGLILSFTRAAWLGTAAAALLLLVLAARIFRMRVRVSRLVVPPLVVMALFAMLMLLPGNVGIAFRFKVYNLFNVESETALARLLTYTLALQQAVQHPFVGWGTFSFAPLTAQGNDFQQYENWRRLWISDYFLLAFHDTGIVGLGLWIGMLWSCLARGLRAVRAAAAADPRYAARVLVLGVAIVGFLIPFLTTSGFSLGFPWLFMGLLGAYTYRGAERGAAELPAAGAPLVTGET